MAHTLSAALYKERGYADMEDAMAEPEAKCGRSGHPGATRCSRRLEEHRAQQLTSQWAYEATATRIASAASKLGVTAYAARPSEASPATASEVLAIASVQRERGRR